MQAQSQRRRVKNEMSYGINPQVFVRLHFEDYLEYGDGITRFWYFHTDRKKKERNIIVYRLAKKICRHKRINGGKDGNNQN